MVTPQERIAPGAGPTQVVVLDHDWALEHRPLLAVGLEALVGVGPDTRVARHLALAVVGAAARAVALVLLAVALGAQVRDVGQRAVAAVRNTCPAAAAAAYVYYSLALATDRPTAGQPVTAMGQHFGEHRREATGRVVEESYLRHGISFFVHDASQGSTQSGSGAYGAEGELLGINMLDAPDDHGRTLALPATTLREVLDEFTGGSGDPATRCFECQHLTFEAERNTRGRCTHCGAELILPGQLEDAEPSGVNATIESIIRAGGHDPRLARRGPNLWNIRQGSATIQIAYHEESGLVTGDAHLCQLPEVPSPDLFAYLLRENARTQQLSFSTYGRDIILSLLIYDRYLTVDTALPRFEYLFEQADAYDNILVERYGAGW